MQIHHPMMARLGGQAFILLFSDLNDDSLTKKLTDLVAGMKGLNLPHPSSTIAPYITVRLGATMGKSSALKGFTLPINEIINVQTMPGIRPSTMGEMALRLTLFRKSHTAFYLDKWLFINGINMLVCPKVKLISE